MPADPVAARREARHAVHGERPVPAGHQEQARPDRDLGALQRERHRLHQRAAHRDGDRPASADRHRRAGRQALRRVALSADRQRHAPADPAGQPLRHRRDHAGQGRSDPRDAGPRRWRPDDDHARRALHQRRHRQSAGGARQPNRAALGDQLRRRLLRVPDAGAGTRDGAARLGHRRDGALRRGARSWAATRPSSTCRARRPTSRARS